MSPRLAAGGKMQAEKQLAIERRRVEIEAQRLRLQQAAIAYRMAQNWGSTDGDWYGGWLAPPEASRRG